MARVLAPGTPIPDLTLPRLDGTTMQLRGFIGARTLVIYFYPKDLSPGCTKQACGFRDAYEQFLAAGAEVIGISAGTPAARAEFITKNRLPFILLADPDGAARTAFGVDKTLGLDTRVTFVVDRSGLVRHVCDAQVRVGKHLTESLAMVTELAGPRNT